MDVDDDGRETSMSKWGNFGVGDLHSDVKSLFCEVDTLNSSEEFFEKKLARTNQEMAA